MKWYLSIALITCITLTASAQTANIFSRSSYIEPYKLEVTYNKTTNLIFPATITSVDRGSQDILVQKATGVENILRIKAGAENFAETNLSVITADGKLYSFVVGYISEPSYLNVDVKKILRVDSITEEPIIYTAPSMNKSLLERFSDSVLSRGSNMRSIRAGSSKVSIALNALYIQEDVMFCKFLLKNKSNINYDIDQLHFYIRDRKKADRTASQEIKLHTLTIVGDTVVIRSESKVPWIIAFPKFTIPDGKYLSVEMMERNGGRNLFLKVKNRHIMKAAIL